MDGLRVAKSLMGLTRMTTIQEERARIGGKRSRYATVLL